MGTNTEFTLSYLKLSHTLMKWSIFSLALFSGRGGAYFMMLHINWKIYLTLTAPICCPVFWIRSINAAPTIVRKHNATRCRYWLSEDWDCVLPKSLSTLVYLLPYLNLVLWLLFASGQGVFLWSSSEINASNDTISSGQTARIWAHPWWPPAEDCAYQLQSITTFEFSFMLPPKSIPESPTGLPTCVIAFCFRSWSTSVDSGRPNRRNEEGWMYSRKYKSYLP